MEVQARDGTTDVDRVREVVSDKTAALVIQNPNFFGSLEDVQQQVDIAHAVGALAIASVDPISLGLIQPPGDSTALIL